MARFAVGLSIDGIVAAAGQFVAAIGAQEAVEMVALAQRRAASPLRCDALAAFVAIVYNKITTMHWLALCISCR